MTSMTALADAEADILASTHWKELIALDTNCISSDCCNCIIGAEPINTSTADEDFIEGQSETNGISSLTFDSCGKHLAAGMKNGKIVLITPWTFIMFQTLNVLIELLLGACST